MNIITALKGYLAFHIACALVNLIFIYLNTGVTDYGGAAGFLPSVAFASPFADPTDRIVITTTPGDNAADSAFFLLTMLGRIGDIVKMMTGLFIFGYPILTDVGTGTYTWVALGFQIAGTIGTVGFILWLLDKGLRSGLLGNIWVLVLLGIIGSIAVSAAIFT